MLQGFRNELDKRQYLLWVIFFGLVAMTYLYFVPMLAIIFVLEMIYEIISERKILFQLESNGKNFENMVENICRSFVLRSIRIRK